MSPAIRLRRGVPPGQKPPRGYALAWYDHAFDFCVVYPVPLHLVARVARSVWHWVLYGWGRPRVSLLDRLHGTQRALEKSDAALVALQKLVTALVSEQTAEVTAARLEREHLQRQLGQAVGIVRVVQDLARAQGVLLDAHCGEFLAQALRELEQWVPEQERVHGAAEAALAAVDSAGLDSGSVDTALEQQP